MWLCFSPCVSWGKLCSGTILFAVTVNSDMNGEVEENPCCCSVLLFREGEHVCWQTGPGALEENFQNIRFFSWDSLWRLTTSTQACGCSPGRFLVSLSSHKMPSLDIEIGIWTVLLSQISEDFLQASVHFWCLYFLSWIYVPLKRALWKMQLSIYDKNYYFSPQGAQLVNLSWTNVFH